MTGISMKGKLFMDTIRFTFTSCEMKFSDFVCGLAIVSPSFGPKEKKTLRQFGCSCCVLAACEGRHSSWWDCFWNETVESFCLWRSFLWVFVWMPAVVPQTLQSKPYLSLDEFFLKIRDTLNVLSVASSVVALMWFWWHMNHDICWTLTAGFWSSSYQPTSRNSRLIKRLITS